MQVEILSFRILAGALVIFEKLDFEKKGGCRMEFLKCFLRDPGVVVYKML